MTVAEQELERLLQESLDLIRRTDHTIKVRERDAVAVAVKLRALGVPWESLAKVMGFYHGIWYGAAWWRNRCRAAGLPPKPLSDGSVRVPPWLQRAES